MIDYVKIHTRYFDEAHLVNHPKLNFSSAVNTDTGEILCNTYGTHKKTAEHQGLTITIYNNSNGRDTLLLYGSLHKFHNQGLHNANSFFFDDFLCVVDKLMKELHLDPSQCFLQNLEIGVNIEPPTATKNILKGLLLHRGKAFKRISMEGADYYQVQHSRYYIKAYDKQLHYPQYVPSTLNRLVRIELKYLRMVDIIGRLKAKDLVQTDYICLHDLCNANVWKVLGQMLIDRWNEILMYDYSLDKKLLPKRLKKLIDKWQNIHFWERLDKQKRSRQKEQLYKTISDHSQQIQKNISDLIKNKCGDLSGLCADDKLSFEDQKDKLPATPFKLIVRFKNVDQLTELKKVKVGLSNSIHKSLLSPVKETLGNKAMSDLDIPDYQEWINRPGELPF